MISRLKKNQRILLSSALVLLGCVLLIVSIVSFDAEYELGDSFLMVCSRFGVLAVCVALAVLLLRPKMKPEHMLLLLGIPLGLCYMLMVAPFSAPDEHAHYLAILAHVCPLINGGMVADSNYLDTVGLVSHVNTLEGIETLITGLTGEQLTGELVPFSGGNTTFVLVYLPQIIGVSIAMLLKLSRMWVMLLGSLCNLAAYLTLCYFAVKQMPRWKWTMVFAALVPMAMQQAGSLSPDGMINGMALLLIAQILRLILQEGKITRRQGIALAVTGIVQSPGKVVYILLLVLLMAVPAERFSSKGRKWGYVLGVLGGAALMTVLVQIPYMMNQAALAADGGTGYYTISWILAHPFETIQIFLHTLMPSTFFWLAETSVGSQLSGLTLNMEGGMVWSFILVMLMSVYLLSHEGAARNLRPGERAASLGVAMLVILAVYGVMMISWTPMYAEGIEGVQGRYFVPLIPLVLVALDGGNVSVKKSPLWFLNLCYGLLHVYCLSCIMNGTM